MREGEGAVAGVEDFTLSPSMHGRSFPAAGPIHLYIPPVGKKRPRPNMSVLFLTKSLLLLPLPQILESTNAGPTPCHSSTRGLKRRSREGGSQSQPL